MGAVRNLFVRIGGDASGAVRGFKDASRAGASAEKSIKKSTAQTKQSIRETFASSVPSIKEYTAQIAQTKSTHQTAAQNVNRLKDEISRLTGIYDTVKNATSGLDLSKPLSELMVDAEKTLTTIESKRKKLEAELSALTSDPKTANSKRTATLQAELNQLAEKSRYAQARMEDLDRIADAVGSSNMGYASAQGLEQLQQKIIATENELRTTQTVANEAKSKLQGMGVGVSAWTLIKKEAQNVKVAALGIPEAFRHIVQADPSEGIATRMVRVGRSIKQIPANILHGIANGFNRISNAIHSIPEIPGRIVAGLKNIGNAAAQAVGAGINKLWGGLKRLGAAAGRGIASLPGKLRNIGRSAASSSGGLGKMVRSIRNIGIASLGMRVATGIFGRMRSVISSYISQNEELNASVTSIKNQMGEALLPAINVVIAAMQNLMPVVTQVSSAINSVFKSLFGDIATTSKKVAATAEELNTYGFDQITKESENESDSASAATTQDTEQSALVTKLTGWLHQLKAAFMAGDWKTLGTTLADGINSVFDAVRNVDVGGIFGNFVNSVVTTLHSLFSGIDFLGIGMMLGQKMTDAFKTVNWNTVGEVIGMVLLALPSVLVGWALETDWFIVGESISTMISAALKTGTEWIASVDWLKLGDCVADLIAGVDWGGLASNLFQFLGAAIGACVGLLWGALDNAVASIMNYFADSVEAAGGNIGKAIVNILIDIFEGLINGLIGLINDLLKGINMVLGAGSMFGIDLSIPMIPKLSLPRAARGTIVSEATNLTVGEDGTEAVVPLEKHTEWIDVLAAKLTAKTAGGGGGGSAIFQFYLGNRKITEHVIKDINQITRENGVCPINV